MLQQGSSCAAHDHAHQHRRQSAVPGLPDDDGQHRDQPADQCQRLQIGKTLEQSLKGGHHGESTRQLDPQKRPQLRDRDQHGRTRREPDDHRMRHDIHETPRPGEPERELHDAHQESQRDRKLDISRAAGFSQRREQGQRGEGNGIGGPGNHQATGTKQGRHQARDHGRVKTILHGHAGDGRKGKPLRQHDDRVGQTRQQVGTDCARLTPLRRPAQDRQCWQAHTRD